MALKKFLTLYREQEDKPFIFFAMLCGFLITAEYAITKPTSNSIFLSHYSVQLYPYAWLLTVPVNFLVVSLYNRFLDRLGCFKVFLCTTVGTIFINLLSGLFVERFPPLSFLLYIWKDLYVLLMFQQVWSLIHTKIDLKKAKYLYGIIFGVSGVGAVFGSLFPGFLAIKIGSEPLLFMTLPLYLLIIFSYDQMLKKLGKRGIEGLKFHDIQGGVALIRCSTTLKFILLIVVLMQLSSTIMDYQFNMFLKERYPFQDERTEFYGRLWGIINLMKLSIQFFATFLLLKVLGLRRSHFVVPSILLGNAILNLMQPAFGVITYSFSMIKSFDYSIFNIIKEMLYIPLKTSEKFKAKAIIDVFAYRSAKALASFFVLGMEFLLPGRLPFAYSYGPLALFMFWIFALFFYFRKKEEQKLLEA